MNKQLSLMLLLTISIFIYLWQQNTAIRLAYKIGVLQIEYNDIVSENDNLKLKINSMLALEKLHKIAKERNFVALNEQSIVHID